MSTPHPRLKLNDGHFIPVLGLGTYSDINSDDRLKVVNAVYEAIKCGYRHIDTTFCYFTEDEVGKGVRRAIEDKICSREDLFITTKIWISNMKHDKLVKQANESNKHLNLGYIDLLLVHFPTAIRDNVDGEELDDHSPHPALKLSRSTKKPFFDLTLDIHEETWGAMEKVKADGIARSIGVANYNIKQLSDLLAKCKVKPVVNQVECNPQFPQVELHNYCQNNGILLTAYFALGGGPRYKNDPKPNGKVEKTETNAYKELKDHPIITSMAEKYGKTPQQIMLRFQVERGIVVLAKSVTPLNIQQNQDIFDFKLSKDDMATLEGVATGIRGGSAEFLKGHPQYPF